ncbi:hypothetical protein V5735_07470 (plasmid) [Haladaptatus sp. SPP-AMP-3]|uniref:hypothetical protein n=1 Tax=Haladaptatus sp. SPP-AMP-3 TaxID=3121295 RepID=UPI003C2D9D21
MRSQPPVLRLVGILAFIVGVVGYTVFGWRFESTSNPVVTTLALACVVLAVAATIWRTVGSS